MHADEVSESFCVVPWLHRFVDERGFLKVCCMAEGAANFLTGPDGKRLHIQGRETEEDIFNSPRLKELRRTMLRGEWDPVCAKCLTAERAGGTSSRNGRNHRFRRRVPDLLSHTADDGAITTAAVRHLDLRLGNYCNLTCRMCTPGASKLWVAPYNRVQPEAYALETDRLQALRNIDWVSDPGVWRKFREQLPFVEFLQFAGGEPMMIPEMIQALRMCVDSGFAGQMDLTYNTNITLLPEDATDLWPHFKSVSLKCSVDGYGPLNDYIRRPSRWHDIDLNLRKIDANFHRWNLKQVFITTTVQVYNVLDLDKLYAYLRSGFEHILPAPDLNPLTWPAYLAVQNLPALVRELARTRLMNEKVREKYSGRGIEWLLSSIDVILECLDGPEVTDHWQDFRHFTLHSDREFGDSFEAAAPELASLLTRATATPSSEAVD